MLTTTTTSVLLPPEVLVRVFSILGNVQDLARVQLVCRTFHSAATADETIWREIAIRKYGADIHDRTVHLYDGSSYKMLKDDNRLGACPIIHNPGLCLYKYNHVDYWFACLIRWVRWHRLSRTVQIYVDARGERDLRDPMTSGVWRGGIVAVDVDEVQDNGEEGSSEDRPSRPQAFDNMLAAEEQQQRPPGHYKGVLIYPENLFLQPAEYVFCYANGHVISPWERELGWGERDYTETVILRFGPQESLKDAFPEYGLEAASTNDDDDDDDDEDESDRERWRRHVPPAVMNRREWWV